MKVNPIIEQLGAYPIALVHERARALAAAGKRVIDFSIGDPREPTPAFVAQAARDAIPTVSQYPLTRGIPELRSAVSDYLYRRFRVRIDPDTQVIPTSGSKEAVFNSPLAFVDPSANDWVTFATPGYPIYQRGTVFAGGRANPLALSGDFVLRAGQVSEEAWARSRMIWICSPHNPTGSVATASDLAELYSAARDSETLVMADECYVDVYEDAEHPDGPPSMLQVSGDAAAGVLAFYSCSKRSGMTGYRSGAIIGDAAAIEALKKLRSATGTASPDFVQSAAVAAWSDDVHAAERRAVFAKKRAVLRPVFDAAGMPLVASTAGLYMWVRVCDDLAVTDRLLDHGIVCSPGRYFGKGGEGYLRLALVPTLEECEAAVEVLEAVL